MSIIASANYSASLRCVHAPKIFRVSDVTDGNSQFICKEAACDARDP